MNRSHQLILVGRDRGEDRLGEDERFVFLFSEIADLEIVVVRLLASHQMYSGLILVHRVQNDLQSKGNNVYVGKVKCM